MNLYKEAARLSAENVPFSIAIIIESKGSTPRHTGKMIVLEDRRIIGTIGGGFAEKFVIDEAVKAIKEDKSRIVEYKLNSDIKDGIPMLCGGNLKVFIEVNKRRPRLVLLGGGHVNYALSKFAALLDYELIVVEDREEFGNKERFPTAKELYVNADITAAVEKVIIDNNTYIIIATKDADEKSLRKVIDSEAAYIGVIGSRRKAKIIMKHLEDDKFDTGRFERLHLPIGLDIGSETPEEIAVSILAEIMKVKSEATGKSFTDLMQKG
ncbi:MAG: XdhC/CoxI family protein [Spirochaetota bacterium]